MPTNTQRTGDEGRIKKKYIICPGEVRSKSDNDIHYISSSQLMRLYGVESHECIIVDSPMSAVGLNWQDYIVLRPRTDGNYSLPERLKNYE